ncbi:MAG: FTR1 family protein [Candidatus Thorarchaeota archaeon]|nr:FTR1 family protein [Candidatus Thorarchaeota archaeon]
MASSYLLSLREGIEAALLIGIVLGGLSKVNRTHLSYIVWRGTISALAISFLIALALNRLGASLVGDSEKIYEGITMLFAAGILTWMIFWMHSHSRTLRNELETDVRRAVLDSGKKALFVLAFVAVLREGVELAIFLTAASMTSSAQETFIGVILGLGTAVVLGWSLFKTAIKLDLRKFFLVTGTLLILFAAGLVAHGVHEFNELGWIPPIIDPLWDTNFILDEKSAIGLLLKALFGYNGNPSLSEVSAYVVYFIAIVFGLRWNAQKKYSPQKI